MIKCKLGLLIIFILISGKSIGAKESSLTLKEAISLALVNNQDLSRSQDNVEMSRLNLVAAEKEYQPKIGLESKTERTEAINYLSSAANKYTASLNYNWPLLTFTSGQFTSSADYTITGLSDEDPSTAKITTNPKIALIWNQPLSKGGRLKMRSPLIEANKGCTLAQIEHKEFKERLILEVTIRYFNLLKAQKRTEQFRRCVDVNQSLLEWSKNKLKAGLIPELDVMNVEVKLAQNKDNLIQAEEEEKNNQKVMTRLLSLNEESKIIPVEEIEIPSEFKDLHLEKIEDALRNREDIKRLKVEIEKGEREILIAKSLNKPTLVIEGGYIWTGEGKTLREGIEDFSVKSWAISCKVLWPFFDSSATGNSIKKAQLDYQISKNLLKKLEEDIEDEIFTIHQSLKASARRINLLSLNLKMAEEMLKITQLKYEMGLISIRDLLEDQMTVSEINNSLLEARIDYLINKDRLLWTYGKIGEEYGF